MVTIGMPVFNDIDFIEESLQSILSQDFTDFILLISDDGSTDGSDTICKQYAAKDDRIRYTRQPKNLGISKNMKFLLTEAKTPYFMWAGDDDLWDKTYLSTCIQLLENHPDAIVAFTKLETIDKDKNTLLTISNPEYSNDSAYKRLKAFAKNPIDGFGYGLFRRELITEVNFPVWWWPNKKTPYNNIYPPLCHYLAKGNYVEATEKPLFFKRIKLDDQINHSLTGSGNGFLETFAFIIRRFNLVTYASREIRKSGSFGLMLRIYPVLFYQWFLKSVGGQFALIFSRLFKRKKA